MQLQSFRKGPKPLISTTPSLLRAAAAGDVENLKTLLAQGADLDGTTEGGQTALILASISGLSEVVRLLLGAGADVLMKDRLGLTAVDWSKRRGFSDVAELLESAAGRDAVSAQVTMNTLDVSSQLAATAAAAPSHSLPITDKQGSTSQQDDGWEQERSRLEHVARIEALFDQLRVADDSHPSAEPKGSTESRSDELRQARLKVEDERIRAHRENQRRIEATSRLKEEHRTDEEERAANELAREKSRLESERIAAESRRRVEEEVYKRSQRGVQTGLTAEPESVKEKSERTEVDAARINANLPTEQIPRHPDTQETFVLSHSGPPPNVLARPTVWALMTITLAGGVLIGYRLNAYLSTKDDRATATVAAPVEQPVSLKREPTPTVTRNLPLVGGPLKGAEENLPEPEYPAAARREEVAGTIIVRVRVNNRGRVILALSTRGDERLRAAAIQAAEKATFLPLKLPSNEGTVSGTITYTFKP